MKDPGHCTRCGEALHPARVVWLELSQDTGRYYKPSEFPQEDTSQGAFEFGQACARRALKGDTKR